MLRALKSNRIRIIPPTPLSLLFFPFSSDVCFKGRRVRGRELTPRSPPPPKDSKSYKRVSASLTRYGEEYIRTSSLLGVASQLVSTPRLHEVERRRNLYNIQNLKPFTLFLATTHEPRLYSLSLSVSRVRARPSRSYPNPISHPPADPLAGRPIYS